MKFAVLLISIFSISLAQAFDAAKEWKTNCATCHTIGGGDKIGPDLAGLSKRRKEAWIIKFVKYPTGMMEGDEEEEGYEKADPIAAKLMAAYKPSIMAEQELEDDQIKALLKYIDTQSAGKEAKGKVLTIK